MRDHSHNKQVTFILSQVSQFQKVSNFHLHNTAAKYCRHFLPCSILYPLFLSPSNELTAWYWFNCFSSVSLVIYQFVEITKIRSLCCALSHFINFLCLSSNELSSIDLNHELATILCNCTFYKKFVIDQKNARVALEICNSVIDYCLRNCSYLRHPTPSDSHQVVFLWNAGYEFFVTIWTTSRFDLIGKLAWTRLCFIDRRRRTTNRETCKSSSRHQTFEWLRKVNIKLKKCISAAFDALHFHCTDRDKFKSKS